MQLLHAFSFQPTKKAASQCITVLISIVSACHATQEKTQEGWKGQILSLTSERKSNTEIANMMGYIAVIVWRVVNVKLARYNRVLPTPPRRALIAPGAQLPCRQEAEGLHGEKTSSSLLGSQRPRWVDGVTNLWGCSSIFFRKSSISPQHSAAKEPLLTEKMIKKRILRQEAHQLDWGLVEVCHVQWRIYCLYCQLQEHQGQEALTMSHYKQKYSNIVTTVKHSSSSTMVWGCFSGKAGGGALLPALTWPWTWRGIWKCLRATLSLLFRFTRLSTSFKLVRPVIPAGRWWPTLPSTRRSSLW